MSSQSSEHGVPFLDLVTPHLELQEELLEAARQAISTGMFIGGPVVEQFEREFARFCGSRYCVGVSSGTDALRFALMATGIGRGAGVVTVPNTFAATIEAIIQTGATTHFVDVDPATSNMSVEGLRHLLKSPAGPSIKAIVPVHLYGDMCDMDPIMALAEEHGLTVIEDACQAHGSRYLSKGTVWRGAGTIGAAAAFSFYPGKNLGACGEAGAVTTDDPEVAQRIRIIRDHGQNEKYHHAVEGYNGRLDALQAGLLLVKLPHLQEWNDRRRAAAAIYSELLHGAPGIEIMPTVPWSHGNYHLYVVRSDRRDELRRHLAEAKIGFGMHYPVPLHLQKAFQYLGYRAGAFPVAEKLAGQIISLPMFPQITPDQQRRVAETLHLFSAARVP
ncbi:MAG TPA: DegT/DnrJ/EryC1/StrS family aminotransferase [Terriglobia bacterium]|nr:DegT/DnrJ/EryC1/StrS family aminotransferase [Terriglobia bacterium]